MTLPDHLRRMFDHLFWADRRVVDRLLESTVQVEPCTRLLAHLLAAEQVWLARLLGRAEQEMPIWPALSREECASLAGENRFAYARYLRTLTAEELQRVSVYRNSQGIEFQTPVRDVLTHVAMHGSYHRGQIALLLRTAGGEPVNTDYITFVREAPVVPPPMQED